MECSFCGAPPVADNGQGHFVCGSFMQGALRRKGKACDYIASLHNDLVRLVATTTEELQDMVSTRVRELMGR